MPSESVENDARAFKRALGLLDASAVVVGSMIGSGIFLVSAETARHVGSPALLLLCWVLAGLLTVIAALCYSELSSLFPQAGGQYLYLREAYGPLAGFLYGWTRSGQRPTFHVVTGVSTGALIATYAFLGPQYDERLRVLYTTITTRDVVRRRPLYGLISGDAAYSSEPLANLIDESVTVELLAEVRAAHACGRRLFVGTTNLDTGRPVVWDMGAIAASSRPDRREHFRDVLLASASVPGALPPVRIPVTYNGKTYYVCCTGCRDEFKANPEKYVKEFEEKRKKEKEK